MLPAAILAALAGWVWQGLYLPLARHPKPQWFEVSRGATVRQVGRQLHERGVLRTPWSLPLLARLQRSGHRIQAGKYRFSPDQRPAEILGVLVNGQVAEEPQVRVTFPEGWTLRQMAAEVERSGLGSAATFVRLATEAAGTFGRADLPAGASLEGYLFPDTYFLPPDADERQVIGRMLKQFDSVTAPLEGEISSSTLSVHEIVTLASMVEREARMPGERPRIAGVYYNRLKRKMRLECDATVQYALGEHQTRLLYRHLEIDSPYNTYLHAGLPPGPIANPGRASLEAAVRPEQSEYLYYVAQSDGSHVFSRTYQEHLRAVRQVRGGS